MKIDLRSDDQRWMRQAIELAETAMYATAPNPRVACLIVRDGRLLASGVTQAAGGPHAEIMALRVAREQGTALQGSTFYVTLEPCSHHGRTPPCVQAVIAARPARVVIAMTDPNPLVAGRGVDQLRAAGIDVAVPLLAQQALAVNPGFVARMTRKTPWTWLKLAASLDGRSALHNGQSQWITGPSARADGHHWRARSCVVLTGAGTVRADNPQLTVREVDTTRVPIKAVVDTRFQIDENARLFDGGETWIFTCNRDQEKTARLARRNVRVIPMPRLNDGVDLAAVMRWLGEHDINEVHVEAGGVLNGALLQAGCVDELLIYMAPVLLGDAIGMVDLPALQSLPPTRPFEFIDCSMLGADVRLRARHGARWTQLLDAISNGGEFFKKD